MTAGALLLVAQPSAALANVPPTQPATSQPTTSQPAEPSEPAEPPEPPEPAEPAPPSGSLIGQIVIFNDEIIEPVSVPISLCGTNLMSPGAKLKCGSTRVSDDDG